MDWKMWSRKLQCLLLCHTIGGTEQNYDNLSEKPVSGHVFVGQMSGIGCQCYPLNCHFG